MRLFARDVPFELRTPITTIRGFAELLKKDAQNFTDQQLDYLSNIQLGSDHLFKIANFATDYARYGFTKSELSHPIRATDFEDVIIKPMAEHFSELSEQVYTVSENYMRDPNLCGLFISDLAIQRALDRIFGELFSFYAVDPISILLSCLKDKFVVQIICPNEVRAEPLDLAMYKNRYEDGDYFDGAVEAIVALYDGSLQYGIIDGIIQIEISFPLVEIPS